MPIAARIILDIAAALITLGGLYDLFTPKLPSNLQAMCMGNERASRLVRELLRALGGALAAIGISIAILISEADSTNLRRSLIMILILVVPVEGINAFCMRRVGSPYLIPAGFVSLTLLGVLLAWPGML